MSTLKWLFTLLLMVAARFAATPAAATHQNINCSFSVTNLNFSSIDVTLGSAIDATATATFSCTGSVDDTTYRFCLNLDAGQYSTGSQREMGSGTNRLNYDIYSNSARTTQWGSWITGFQTAGLTVDVDSGENESFGPINVTMYGRVAAGQQTMPPGSYVSAFTGDFVLHYGRRPDNGSCDIFAWTATASFNVLATVATSCSISAADLNFGTTGVLTANLDATNSITVQCSNGTPYDIGLDAGTATGATVTTRKMTGGAATIGYALYSNSGRTTNWGNTVATDTVSGTGTGADQSLTVYGRVPSQTTPVVGTYNDTIVVTVTY